VAKPITITLPHELGQAEARRRLDQGFASIGQQATGGVTGFVSFQKRWEGDRLQFEGGALGQKMTGRIEVLPESVIIQIDLPELLAALGDRLLSAVKQQTQKLLAKS
jgi:Putative polyhydroxyalkanoic acid system protein (PHA_gran_rgn)